MTETISGLPKCATVHDDTGSLETVPLETVPLAFRYPLLLLLPMQAWLMLTIAWCTSPNVDELAHLASGIYHWQTARMDVYRVNPPLVRMACTLPLLVWQPQHSVDLPIEATRRKRLEWALGHQLLRWPHARLRAALRQARCVAIGLVLVGLIAVVRLADRLAGLAAAWVAGSLYATCPTILAWGATLCPDAPAAALTLCAVAQYVCWQRCPTISNALRAGLLLGAAILAKSSVVIVASGLIVTATLRASRLVRRHDASNDAPLMGHFVVMLLAAWFVLCSGYGWQNMNRSLADLPLQSNTMVNIRQLLRHTLEGATGINRWPIPLPEDFLLGIDTQRQAFETPQRSFLLGQWRQRGWWYYYAVAAVAKLPISLWLLAMLVLVPWRHPLRLFTSEHERRWTSMAMPQLPRPGSESQEDEPSSRSSTCELLFPASLLFLVVSSQTGFSRHFRYVLPALPLLYVAIACHHRIGHLPKWLVGGLVLSFAAESLSVWPLSHAFFSIAVGGPRQGQRILLDANLDWGEETDLAAAWLGEHPSPWQTFIVSVYPQYAASVTEQWQVAPDDPHLQTTASDALRRYIASVHRVADPADPYHFLDHLPHAAQIGYAHRVYEVQEADLIRLSHFKRKHRKSLPAPLDRRQVRQSAMDIQTVSQRQRPIFRHRDLPRERQSSPHPAIGPHMKMGRKANIARVVQQRNTFQLPRGDRPAIVDPFRPLAKTTVGPLLIDVPFGIADPPASIVNSNRLRHPHTDDAKRRLPKDGRIVAPFGQGKMQIDHVQPMFVLQTMHAYRAALTQ